MWLSKTSLGLPWSGKPTVAEKQTELWFSWVINTNHRWFPGKLQWHFWSFGNALTCSLSWQHVHSLSTGHFPASVGECFNSYLPQPGNSLSYNSFKLVKIDLSGDYNLRVNWGKQLSRRMKRKHTSYTIKTKHFISTWDNSQSNFCNISWLQNRSKGQFLISF